MIIRLAPKCLRWSTSASECARDNFQVRIGCASLFDEITVLNGLGIALMNQRDVAPARVSALVGAAASSAAGPGSAGDTQKSFADLVKAAIPEQ
jgi:hypothetical protein